MRVRARTCVEPSGLEIHVLRLTNSPKAHIVELGSAFNVGTIKVRNKLNYKHYHLMTGCFVYISLNSLPLIAPLSPRGHAVREVGGSNPGRGIIVGRVFHPTKQPVRFFRRICHLL